MIIPPYPFTLEDPPNVPLEDAWYARPQLFFSCWFRPTGGRPPSQGNYTIGPDDFQMELVFFSTFEELQLPARGPMDHATTKLYEPSPTPILFVAPLNNVLGRVPLFPLFLDGNATPTIPHHLRHLKASAFPHGAADAAKPEGRRGSNAYEVNTWLWQFGRGRERLGGLSVSETEDRREQVVSAGAKRGAETRRRREAARRGDK
jgi:hypothetical protein